VITHHFGGGVYAKETHIPQGSFLMQHKHAFDHMSILASGTVEVSVDDQVTTHTGPACLVIEAGKNHGVRALTDVVWYCVHATDCTDADTVDEVLIAKE
jgi:quercetin dioxygenase-like cupin family protein